MSLETKYFILNKKINYKNGCFKNCQCNEEGSLIQIDKDEVSTFISSSLDSKETNTIWHKILIESDQYEEGYIEIFCFCSNELEIKVGETHYNIDKLIRDNEYSVEEKKSILMQNLEYKTTTNSKMLLNTLEGRYLWFLLDFKSYSNNKIEIESIKVEFPLDSFLKYFPSIYARDKKATDLMIRFITIFQELYIEIEESIDKKYLDFDPNIVTEEKLEALANFVDFEAIDAGNKALRELIIKRSRLVDLKGTIKGIKLLTKLILGKNCILVENYKVFEKIKNIEQIKNLETTFKNNKYWFTLIIQDCYDLDLDEKEKFIAILDKYIPAKTRYKAVFLNDNTTLSDHSIIGMGLKVVGNTDVYLAENTTIPVKI